ncbi:hypothetical protein PENSPDRAFT_667318 [Peniophora sp. CONT]|nr:hypothetical protein PENSPDRAFT_667318 [Peniophora sp. CONT]
MIRCTQSESSSPTSTLTRCRYRLLAVFKCSIDIGATRSALDLILVKCYTPAGPGSLTLAEGKQLSTEDLISITSTREAVRQKTQVMPAEQDVSSYIAKHVLHTEPIGVVAAPATFSARPSVPVTASPTPSQSIPTRPPYGSVPAVPSASMTPAPPTTSTMPAHSTPTTRSSVFGLGGPFPGAASRSTSASAPAPATTSTRPASSTPTSHPSPFGLFGAPAAASTSPSPFGLAPPMCFTSMEASSPSTTTAPTHSTPASAFSFRAF